MSEFEIHVDDQGREYRLGLLPTPDDVRNKFAAVDLPTVSEGDWQEISRRELFYSLNWFPDQIDTSGCTGFSSAMVASKVRVLAGQQPVKLSGAYLYSLINGGSDNGSNIGDALNSIESHGVCSEASCDVHRQRSFIYRKNTKQFDAEAGRFRGIKSYRVHTAEQAVATIQRGGILEYAIRAGRGTNFGRLDGEGVCAFTPGGSNHAVHADGFKKTNSHGWCFDSQTWTKDFADKSRWLWPIEYLLRTGGQEMWALFGMADDPNDNAHDPPTPIV
jgi:hypothetical protein